MAKSLTDLYPTTVTRTIAAPARVALIQPGMTFKIEHFGKVREFQTVQKFEDGGGRPCWLCTAVRPAKDGHNTLRRTEAGILTLKPKKGVA